MPGIAAQPSINNSLVGNILLFNSKALFSLCKYKPTSISINELAINPKKYPSIEGLNTILTINTAVDSSATEKYIFYLSNITTIFKKYV